MVDGPVLRDAPGGPSVDPRSVGSVVALAPSQAALRSLIRPPPTPYVKNAAFLGPSEPWRQAGCEMSGHVQDTKPDPDSRSRDGPTAPLEAACEALSDAREAVSRAKIAVRRAEREGSDRSSVVTVEGPRWTWRERLWAAPAETRIGVAELVEGLGVSESWVYRRTTADADDPIPHRKLGGSLRFVVGEVRAWIRDREEAPVSGPMWSPTGEGLSVVERGRA